jgi:hypothetical protein
MIVLVDRGRSLVGAFDIDGFRTIYFRSDISQKNETEYSQPNKQNTLSSVMSSFATLETPGGFPVPHFPKCTNRREFPENCQETDVDKCVLNIVLQKDWTTKVYDESAIKEWSTRSWSGGSKTEGILRYAVDECRWRREQRQHRVGTPAAICKAGLVLSKDNVHHELRSTIMEGLKTLRQDA